MPKNFADKRLMGVNFSGQDLTESDFSGAKLQGCSFVGTMLHSANFSSVSAMGCNFDDSDLTDAQFVGAKFIGSTFRGAIIAGSDINEASLMGCDLDGAVNEVDEVDEVDDSESVRKLDFDWVRLEASHHLIGATLIYSLRFGESAVARLRTINLSFTDCMVRLDESVDREIHISVIKPGVEPYSETLIADSDTSLIDKSDDSWSLKITNQLESLEQ